MLKRIIPVFLLKGQRLVKGSRFNDFIDVGDPISQAKIYDAQGADEIIIVDIDASREGRLINLALIRTMVNHCRLPISVGGGIKTLGDARKCFEAGADKIVINTSAILNPLFIKELATEFGSQSIITSIDVRKNLNDYNTFTLAGTKKIPFSLEEIVIKAIENGTGEILLTSIDQEGTLSGFDYSLYKAIREITPIPFIASGGAGCYDDIVKLFREAKCDACAIGKMLFLRDYDIVRIKAYLTGRKIPIREA